MKVLKLFFITLALSGAYSSDKEEKSFRKGNPFLFKNFRLPNNTKPAFYDLHIKTHLGFLDFSGNVKIEFTAKEATNVITLHSKELKIERISLFDKEMTILHDNLKFEFPQPSELSFLRIKLPKLIKQGFTFVLEIEFSGKVNEEGNGLYRSFFYDDKNYKTYYLASQFQPTFARSVFPCYDEPNIKAKFLVEIEHSKDYRAFSNTESIEQVASNETNFTITRFLPVPDVSTYTIVIAVGPFQVISNNDDRVPQKIIASPSKINKGEANFARELVGPILTTLERHLGVKFPLTKLDHLAVDPYKYEGMDSYGLSIYRENVLLISPTQKELDLLESKKRLIQVIARLHADQFFGSLISPHWWTDFWLKEGFATLYEYFIPDVMYPRYNYFEIFREKHMKPVLEYDIRFNTSSMPISRFVQNPEGIAFNFHSEMIKSKASVVLRMFQAALSPDTFQKGIQLYMRRKIYHSAAPEDLFISLQDAVNEDKPNLVIRVQKAMSSWIYQAGYPIVSVSVEKNNLVVEQHRYPTAEGEIYGVPLTFATAKTPNFHLKLAGLWLYDEKMTVSLQFIQITDKDWIIFNIQQTGLYFVSYTPSLWRLIAGALRNQFNTIHVINRELLMTELMIGYRDLEDVYISDVFEVLTYLTNEDQYDVWLEADKILETIQFHFVGTDAYENFLLFLQYITRHQLKVVGFEDQAGESEDEKRLREMLVDYNCQGLDPLCLAYQKKQLILLLQGKPVLVHFCVAFHKILTPAYDYFLRKVEKDLTFPIRFEVLLGLTCSSDKGQLQLLIQVLQNRTNVVSDAERYYAISRMLYASNEGQNEAIGYLERYPETLSKKEIQYVLKNAINTKQAERRIKQILKRGFESQTILFTDVMNINGGLTDRILWHDNNYDGIEEWFKNNTRLFTEF